MREVEVLKPNYPLQRTRDAPCHTQLKHLVGNRSQAAHGKRPDLTRRGTPQMKIEPKRSLFARRNLANHSA